MSRKFDRTLKINEKILGILQDPATTLPRSKAHYRNESNREGLNVDTVIDTN
jgi:hypothetical protein